MRGGPSGSGRGGAPSALDVAFEEEDAGAFAPFLDAVVKVFATHAEPNWSLPWQRKRQASSTSSGFLIAGRRLLTNAHSVAHYSQVKVKHRGSDTKYLATVLSIGNECDLALLTVADDAFWDAVTPIKLGRLPRLQDSVVVVGYPIGGDTISVTAGVVSRIEMTSYAHSASELLGVQIDAAINSGNSGGPVFDSLGACVGVAFQSLGRGDVDGGTDGIGYIIPQPVIKHFLEDFELNRIYTGFPVLGVTYQTMENKSLRDALGLAPSQKGVLVRSVEPTGAAASVVARGDVLLEFEGQAVAVDGTVPFRTGERIAFSHLVSSKQVGDTATLKVWSNRALKTVTVTLKAPTRMLPTFPVAPPSYFIHAGLVFVPASVPYLRSEYGTHYDFDSPVRLLEQLLHGQVQKEGDQYVVLGHVLAAEVNIGYEQVINVAVKAVNGVPVSNLKQLAALVDGCTDRFLRLDLDHGSLLVVDTAAARAAGPDILAQHSIPRRCSDDIEEHLRAAAGGDAPAAPAAAARGGRKRRTEEAAAGAERESSPEQAAAPPPPRPARGRR